MSISRYSKYVHIQPIRKITPAITDITHTFGQYENIDNLATKYYGDVNLAWIIMSANPEYKMEFLVPAGAQLRIPFPLTRVFAELGINGEI